MPAAAAALPVMRASPIDRSTEPAINRRIGDLKEHPVDDAFFLGVDGGATRCRVRLRDGDGRMLSSAEGPAANIYINRDTAFAAISSTVSAVLSKAGLAEASIPRVCAGVGLAGVSQPADADFLAAAFLRFNRVVIVNDAVTACLGAHAGGEGGAIIAGTGTAGVACIGGNTRIIGGRGFILGDDGSAARIGLEALRAAMRSYDGLAASTPLTSSLLRDFGSNPVRLTNWALQAKPGDFGAYAPKVFAAAAAGDGTAQLLIATAASAIDELARAVQQLGASAIALVGGLARSIEPYLGADVAAVLRPALFDAVDGAIFLAGGVVASRPELSVSSD
jgi:glucosamine kinase